MVAGAPSYRPSTYHPDGDRRKYWVTVGIGERKAGIDLVLADGGVQITGTVADLTGGPIANARVSSTDDDGGRGIPMETDADGHFAIWSPPGPATVLASADGYTDGFARVRAPGAVEVLLTPESAVAGIVIDAATSAPVPGVHVQVGPRDYGYVSGEVVTTDADGRFRVAHLAPGRVVATARSEHGYGRAEGSTLVGLGQSVEGLVVKLFPAVHISGTVRISTTKAPCDNAWVTLHDAETDRSLSAEQYADKTSHAEGVPPGTYAVSVWCEGYQSRPTYAPVVIADHDVEGLAPTSSPACVRARWR